MAAPLLLLSDIHLTFGGEPLLDGAELSLGAGERLCLVGRNGSGKSTLLKIAAGLIEADDGTRKVQPDATIRYLPQEPDLTGFATTLDYVEDGLAPGDPAYRAPYLLEQLGLTGTEAPETLSGGETRRAALARALAPTPDILLLDEPTNHLDLPAIEWLEEELSSLGSALMLISHDRRLLETLGNAVIWLDRGITRRVERRFESFEAWRDEFLEQEALDHHKLDRKIASETEWLHKGVTARRKRNMGRLRALHSLRRDRTDRREATGQVNFSVSEREVSGKRVIDVVDLDKSFGERSIVKDFSTRIMRGDRIGLVGPNGAGKTTLLNMLIGSLAPDTGDVWINQSLEVASLEQNRDTLPPDTRLQDALTGGGTDSVMVGGELRHVVSYLKDFLFTPAQVRMPVSALSGGERGRLMLARALARPSNLLVLDEPTNDLDLETLDLLQEAVADYKGTVLLVSHDRDFLDRIVTSVINWEGDGRWVEYAGGYTDMVAQRGKHMDTRPAVTGPSPKPKSQPSSSSAKAKASAKARLSYKEQYALENLPKEISRLEATITELKTTLSDPALFSRNPDKFQSTSDALTKAVVDQENAEEEWLRLEMRREEIEAGDT